MGDGFDPWVAPRRVPEDLLAIASRWGERSRQLRRWVLFPAIIAAVLAGLAGCLLHLGGAWAVLGPRGEGRYLIWVGSVLAAAFGPAAVVLIPAWIAHRVALSAGRRSFLADAARQGHPVEELRELVRALE